MTLRLVVADDHSMVRAGFSALLAGTQFVVVGEAASAEELLSLLAKGLPDLIVLDVRLGEDDGLTVLEQLREQYPQVPVVMFSGFENPTYLARAAALGAYEYLMKNCSREQLLSTLTNAANNHAPFDLGRLQQTRRNMHRRRESPDLETSLTNREYQVIRHIAMGLSNREIGHSLGISVETVKEHVQNVLRKVDAGDRTQAAVWAVRKGMV